jgi:RecA/RadA recombinase
MSINSKASSLMERIMKTSTVKQTERLLDSVVLQEKPQVATHIPMINLALGGRANGGISAGITTIAGPSRHFKTSFALVMVAAFLNNDPEAVCLFLDNEFGAKKSYFEQYGVDTSRVIHIPFEDIEQLTFETMNQLKELTIKDKVIILTDSIGNASSKKEVENALSEKSSTDMTRAKSLKGYFRMVTPILNIKDIPMICINHTYKTLELYAKDVVGGGTGIMYSSNTVWIIGKNQLKEKDEVTGSKFIIRVEKSRSVKERSQFPITVRWNSGIAKWSGFEDVAEQLNIIQPCKIGKSGGYQFETISGNIIQVLASEIDSADHFWEAVIKDTDLLERMESLYRIGAPTLDSLSFDVEKEEE